MKPPVIIANWKMHKTQEQARAWIDTFFSYTLPQDREIVIAASATLLSLLGELLYHRGVSLAAQNMHWENEGAFTGEISGPQIIDIGATHVLIGHSERRELFAETNETLNKKLHAAFAHGITPVYCIGETLAQKQAGTTEAVLKEQIEQGCEGLSVEYMKKMIVAYEPVWAIGTGEVAAPEYAQETHATIRTFLPQETPLLYGGSVSPETAQSLLVQPAIDGLLVGGASLDPATFHAIVSTPLFPYTTS